MISMTEAVAPMYNGVALHDHNVGGGQGSGGLPARASEGIDDPAQPPVEGLQHQEVRHDQDGHRQHQHDDVPGVLRNRGLMLVSCSSAFRTMTQVGLLTFLPVYLAYELGYSPLVAGICLTVLQVAGFIAAPIAGHLSDKVGRKRVVISSMLLTGVMIVGMALAGKSAVFVLFIALVGFFLYAMRPVPQAWAVETTPTRLAGTGVGLQFGIQAIGASIAPAVFGMIADAYDIYTGFFFLAGTIIFANVLVFFMPDTADGQKAAPATTG